MWIRTYLKSFYRSRRSLSCPSRRWTTYVCHNSFMRYDGASNHTVREQSTTSYREEFKRNKRLQKEQKYERQTTRGQKSKWQVVVGIEIHAELDTECKLFSTAPTCPAQPNTNVSLHDLAFPGMQPVFQRATVIPAIRAALALGCKIQRKSSFDRKHYFYQDQPAGYQITQYYNPFAKDGQVVLDSGDGNTESNRKEVRIEKIQLEQDTAKTMVTCGATTLLDFNRVSHPLIEIISKPDMHSPSDAALYVRKVQSILYTVGAVKSGMEIGGLRADVNVSVRIKPQIGQESSLGQRTEIKNLSSLKAIEDAVRSEMNRQIQILEAGGQIEGETRGWRIGGTETYKLRAKEGEVDYRYMPDADIPPLIIANELVQHVKSNLPASPDSIISRLTEQGLTRKDAQTLFELDSGSRLEYYSDVVEAALEDGKTPKDRQRQTARVAGNFIIHEIPGLLSKSIDLKWNPSLVPSDQLAMIVQLLVAGRLHSTACKNLIASILHNEEGARDCSVLGLATARGFLRPANNIAVDMARTVAPIAEAVFRTNRMICLDIMQKETNKINFIIGLIRRQLAKENLAQTMDPREMTDLIHKLFWKHHGRHESDYNSP